MRTWMYKGIALSSFATFSLAAEVNCRWIPTFEKTFEEVAALVEERSGRKPTIACGGGTDYKICHSCADKLSDEQWSQIRQMMATPAFRNWHFNWHSEEGAQARSIAGQYGGDPNEIHGESFLYMHRELIRAVNANAAALNLPCVSGWEALPSQPDDPVWPMIGVQKLAQAPAYCKSPANNSVIANVSMFNEMMTRERQLSQREVERQRQELEQRISDPAELLAEITRIQAAADEVLAQTRLDMLRMHGLTEAQVEMYGRCSEIDMAEVQAVHSDLLRRTQEHAQPEYLKTHTMGIMGIESMQSWHGRLHINYDRVPQAVCETTDPRPECDNMNHPVSSHVNQHFYKVHGLVDNYIDKWLAQNGYETAAKDCAGRDKCYQWKEHLWLGKVPDFVTATGCTLDGAVEEPPPRGAPVHIHGSSSSGGEQRSGIDSLSIK